MTCSARKCYAPLVLGGDEQDKDRHDIADLFWCDSCDDFRFTIAVGKREYDLTRLDAANAPEGYVPFTHGVELFHLSGAGERENLDTEPGVG